MRIITPVDSSVLQACLDCIPFFDTFSDAEKLDLLDCGPDLLHFNTGEFLIEEGGEDRVLFFLLSGAASVVREGASVPIAELAPGDLFGEIAFLTGQKRTSNVIVHQSSSDSVEGSNSVLSENLLQQICPDSSLPTITFRFGRALLDHLEGETRLKMKDQIIAVLIDRMEGISKIVEETIGSVPEFSIDPDLEQLMEEGLAEGLVEGLDEEEVATTKVADTATPREDMEKVKDQIIQHLVDFIVLLNARLLGEE
jgi:hypothetical protein